MKGYYLPSLEISYDPLSMTVFHRPCTCNCCKSHWSEEELAYGGIVNGVKHYDVCDNCWDLYNKKPKEKEEWKTKQP